ncbi:hypothetical protein ACHAQA_007410 [Verticillium albo-atrum]
MSDCDPDYKNADYAFYRYDPNLGAAIVFIILFACTTGLHFWQMWKTKTWYMTAFVLGGVCEVIGYIGRAIGSQETPGCWSLVPFILQSVLILIGPALMAASIYMVLGRIIVLTDGEKYSPIRRRWLTKLFVTCDVLALVAQAQGGGLMAADDGTNNMYHTGEIVIIIGLWIQLTCFGAFVLVSALFHRRMRRAPTDAANRPDVRWRAYLRALYVASALIWLRSLFRVAEYLEGNKGHLIGNEVWIYLFDALLVAAAMLWMNWYHPAEIGLLLRGETSSAANGLQLVGLNLSLGRQGPLRKGKSSGERLWSQDGAGVP